MQKDLTGKIIIITGANNGIGKETARALAKMKATIILACRDPKRSIPVVEELKRESNNPNVEFMQLDLSDLRSIKTFSEEFKKKYKSLHILINNAGVITFTNKQRTKDGFEMQFGTNHLGHFYLTKLLLDVIEKSAPSRIINVSSMGHYDCKKIDWDDIMCEKVGNPLAVYGHSKLANNLFTKKLQENLKDKNVKVVSLHPGMVRSDFNRRLKNKWYTCIFYYLTYPCVALASKSPSSGAKTSLYCALEDQDKLEGGMYYTDCKVKKENSLALDKENVNRMWTVSEDLIEKALKKYQ